MPRNFNHPTMEMVTLDGVLHALSDPVRRNIVQKLSVSEGLRCNQSCTATAPSTLSFHIRVLREAGLVHSEKKGVEVINTLRMQEMETKFPGLLKSILSNHK